MVETDQVFNVNGYSLHSLVDQITLQQSWLLIGCSYAQLWWKHSTLVGMLICRQMAAA